MRLLPKLCVFFLLLSLFYVIESKRNKAEKKKGGTKRRVNKWKMDFDDHWMHSFKPTTKFRAATNKYEDAIHWYTLGQSKLAEKLAEKKRPIEKEAKNVIFFLGDGMSATTVTSARIMKGQLEGRKFGEESELNMDKLGNIGLAKVYCSDSQVPDSACSATAFLSGVKARIATIGVTSAVQFRDCQAQQNASNHAISILGWAQAAGKSTGLVTTTRVTHATPAGTYAHIADRDWENDMMVLNSGENPQLCDDIAEQLIYGKVGSKINVVFGGGRRELTPHTHFDEVTHQPGKRRDNKNLIETWKELKRDSKSKYITKRKELLNMNTSDVDYVLGLFHYDHLPYVTDADASADPSLPEMTKAAIDILKKNPKGYFLFIEGGRIDHSHHSTKAQKALVETLAMDSAVATAVDATNEEDTLIVVTSDHSHVMTMAGYPLRGNPILGFAGISDVDDYPYTTLSYANGPGFRNPENGERYDISRDNLEHPEYAQIATVPLLSETHGGEDVVFYSKGPFAHILTGVQEQSFIPHAIGYAACIGPGLKYCDIPKESSTSTSTKVSSSTSTTKKTSTSSEK